MRSVWVTDGPSPEEALVAVAVHGNVTTSQLLEAGLSESAIHHRTRQKRLFRVHRGVYSLGRPPSLPLEKAAAAVLACGPDAALSQSSALTLWGLGKPWSEPFHVAVPTRHKRSGIAIHEITNLARTDIRSHSGLLVTSPARALLDCAPTLTTKALRRAMAEARRRGLVHPAGLLDLLERNRTHPGAPAIRATMTDHAPTRSEFEDAFLVFCERHGIPRPLVNFTIAGYEADAYFPTPG
jgi:predicted transcriptional regulator of viral defense system